MEDYENLSFWYPIKRTGVEALFLLPLLICVGVWANFAMRKGRTYQILISSHLLTIIGIFLLLRAVTLIYDIIPKVFLAKLIDFLEVLNIVGLLYYFWILFAVLFTLGLVYFVQRRIAKAKEARKLEIGAKRAEKGECWACGAKLTGGHHCIRCGTSQFIACSNCGKDTLRAGEHCMHCGTSITHQ
jgi:hypothetical protein